jgi:hypothetical protein
MVTRTFVLGAAAALLEHLQNVAHGNFHYGQDLIGRTIRTLSIWHIGLLECEDQQVIFSPEMQSHPRGRHPHSRHEAPTTYYKYALAPCPVPARHLFIGPFLHSLLSFSPPINQFSFQTLPYPEFPPWENSFSTSSRRRPGWLSRQLAYLPCSAPNRSAPMLSRLSSAKRPAGRSPVNGSTVAVTPGTTTVANTIHRRSTVRPCPPSSASTSVVPIFHRQHRTRHQFLRRVHPPSVSFTGDRMTDRPTSRRRTRATSVVRCSEGFRCYKCANMAATVCIPSLNTNAAGNTVVMVPAPVASCYIPCSGAANETCGEFGFVNLYSSPSVSPSRTSNACVLCSAQTLVLSFIGSGSGRVRWEDAVETGEGKGRGVMTMRWIKSNIGTLEDLRTGRD